jgi:hypothetical protein
MLMRADRIVIRGFSGGLGGGVGERLVILEGLNRLFIAVRIMYIESHQEASLSL